ncbi:MAG: tetratricopeptide repeat protein [Armatimonadota bacterium]|nr:tetratricopeptide repeat protein [Armatimonadota bacterium]
MSEDSNETIARARRLIEEGRQDAAVHLLKPVVEEEPDEPAAWAVLGAAWFELGNYAEAEGAARQTVRLRPHSARDWSNLGTILRKRGELEEAARAQRRALQLEPSYTRARVELSKLGKQYAEAEAPPPEAPPDFQEAPVPPPPPEEVSRPRDRRSRERVPEPQEQEREPQEDVAARPRPEPAGGNLLHAVVAVLIVTNLVGFGGWLVAHRRASATRAELQALRDDLAARRAGQAAEQQRRQAGPGSELSFAAVDAMFGRDSKHTVVEMEQLWEGYRGRVVSWQGSVKDVERDEAGGYTLRARCAEGEGAADTTVQCSQSEATALAGLHKEDAVSITGTLAERTDEGYLLSHGYVRSLVP